MANSSPTPPRIARNGGRRGGDFRNDFMSLAGAGQKSAASDRP